MTPTPFRYYFWIILIVAALSSWGTVYVQNLSWFQEPRIPIKVGLKWLHQAQFAGMYIAQDVGLYKDEGLEVELIERDASISPVIDQVIDGELHFGIVSVEDFLNAVDKKKDIIAIAALFQYSPSALISLKDANILTPKDLKGKTIGLPRDTKEARFIIEYLLSEENIPQNAVTYKVVGSRQAEALMQGDVDVVSLYRTNGTYILDKQNIAYNMLLPERYGIDLYNDILVSSQTFVAGHENIVRSFMTATRAGWDVAFANESRAIETVLRYDNKEYHDKEKETYILKKSLPLMKPRESTVFGAMSPIHWDYTYELFYNAGIIGTYDIHRHFLPSHFFGTS